MAHKRLFIAFYFGLIPSLTAILAICFGPVAVLEWGWPYLIAPLMLAMSHCLSMLWVLRRDGGIRFALQLGSAFFVLIFIQATAISLASYQSDFPAFSNALLWNTSFIVPSTVLIGAIAFIAQPYLCIATLDSATMLPKHSIVGLILATTTVACVMSLVMTMNSVTTGQFLLSHFAIGIAAQLCLWCTVSGHSRALRNTVLVATIATLLITTAILIAFRMEASGAMIPLTIYVISLTGLISMDRFIELQVPKYTRKKAQNNNPLDTKPSISRLGLR